MKCKNCSEEVQWAVTKNSGGHVLLDADPTEDGRYVVLPNIGARLATDVDRRLLRPTFRCHWDRCK